MFTDLNPTPRILLGPGPSDIHPRVLRAMATPLQGHLDPEFLALMDEVQELLRYVFQTRNKLTLALPGTGTAGMEAAFANWVEPGDSVVIAVNGYFGDRMCDMASRYGAEVRRLDIPWGEVYAPAQLEAELRKKPAKLLALVQAETSTGALQPMAGLGELAHRNGALLLMDCVTSLGGAPVEIDAWGVDIAYSGTQKCVGCPPGLSPFTASPRAWEVLGQRKGKVPNWYLDLTLLAKYWGPERVYHHTAPINMVYALREALRMVQEEGLEARFARHRRHAELLWAGLEEMGLSLHVPLERRLPSLTTPRVPQGVDELAVRKRLLADYSIEIAGGLGALKGQVWRIGLMGHSSRRENVALLLAALGEILGR
ncbi:MAG: alanine--glyoxylate aminotransferase family protein [Chloroflexi bacterium]|nr:alanine--glyoxylate aminotransferase family protein [Chloroflexota bacterium]